MDKQLQETLAHVTMYSKMGRYISNKILKYNKHHKTQRTLRHSMPHREDYLRIKKKKSKQTIQSQHTPSLPKNVMTSTQPPVGYYKINFKQIQKNPRLYDFNRSVPHFNRQRFFCNQVQPVAQEYPDSLICQYRIKGLTELKRMTGRADIKGSIRKQIEDPHENRFKMIKDLNSFQMSRSRVNMEKDLPRDDVAFRCSSDVPQYDYDYIVPQKRLDTHIIPFERILDRDESFMSCQKGISSYFNRFELKQNRKINNWKKMLPREKTGLLPSYMDKNINTRSSIALVNLKTLEMNCSKIKEPDQKIRKKWSKNMVFIQEEPDTNKQNAIC